MKWLLPKILIWKFLSIFQDTSVSQSDLLNKQAQLPASAVASTVLTAPVVNIPNPIQQFLSQRLEPKALVIRTSQEKKQYAIQVGSSLYMVVYLLLSTSINRLEVNGGE